MATPEELSEIIIREDASNQAALQVLDRTGLRTLIVVDGDGRISGVLTDGDIRRALLSGARLDGQARDSMNRNFVALPVSTPGPETMQHLSNRIMLLPLLDDERRPVDFVTRCGFGFIPAAQPILAGNEVAYVMDCLNSGWISSQGSYVRLFEERFAAWTGSPYAVSVSNGTVALQLALDALGIGPGDEVLVPDLTFAASINAVIHAGATPVLVDVLEDDLTIDPAAAAAAITVKTRAIMPVHLYGQVCMMDEIMALADSHDLHVIEDSAEALGSRMHDRHAGTFGDAGTFSFFGNKLITTGEGGMVLFNDPAVAERARRLRDHGMDPERRYWHLEVGYNFRLTNIQAAIGVAQLERIEQLIEAKLALAARYASHFETLQDRLILPRVKPGCIHSFWNYVVMLDGSNAAEETAALIDFMRQREIDVRTLFYPLHIMPPYRSVRLAGDCPRSRTASAHGLALPSSPKLSGAEIDYIALSLRMGLDAVTLKTVTGRIGA